MEWLIPLIWYGTWATGVGVKKLLRSYNPPAAGALPAGKVWLKGEVIPSGDLLRAPLSGEQVLAWRLIVSQRWPNIAGQEAFKELLDVEDAVDFRLRHEEGEALVRANGVANLLDASLLNWTPQGDSYKPTDRLLSILKRRQVVPTEDIMGQVYVRFVELGVLPGDEYSVAGTAGSEADPTPLASATGRRPPG